MFSVDGILAEKLPDFSSKHPLLVNSLTKFLKYLFHESEFQAFEQSFPHIEGIDFVEQVLEYFEFDYRVFERELERVPTEGRVVIVANHPIGSLDGLALLKMVSEVRPDVRIVATDVLAQLKPLQPMMIGVDNIANKTRKQSIKDIRNWLNHEGAIILFPAGEVSRFGASGIKDGKWNTGFLKFSQSTDAPILPIFINGRNSIFFYALSLLAKPVSTLWLIREMFKQAEQHVDIRVGHLVYPDQYNQLDIKPDAKAKLFKNYVYRLSVDKQKLGFDAEYEAVAHPENIQLLKREIKACEALGETSDGKKIYLYRYQANSLVLREIGRLRELTFRAVKEGSGKRRDIDRFDHYYDHIILWDDEQLDIVGAYRMVRTSEALQMQLARSPLYTQTLFDFSEGFNPSLQNGLELGRSFVQPKYWGRRSLDYLWYGIGAYLKKYPDIDVMFGPVSISQDISDVAKDLLVFFYSEYFGGNGGLVTAPNAYIVDDKDRAYWRKIFAKCQNYQERLICLKEQMALLGESVPALYKQYVEVAEEGGTKFHAFNIDHDFADCIDGFITVDIEKIKASKRKRYMSELNATNC